MENTEMKDRIAHIIRAKNLTAADFAFKLGIQPSNISHLLAGRNNPSLDFIKKLKETFPEYNLDWLIMGLGPITVSEPLAQPAPAESHPASVARAEAKDDAEALSTFAASPDESLAPAANHELKQILFVYADHTFEVVLPR